MLNICILCMIIVTCTSHFLFSCLIKSTITLLCSSYSATVSAPISNRECSSLSCSMYLLRSETLLLGESVPLVQVDRRDFPAPKSGAFGGSSMLSCVRAKIASAQNVYCMALNFDPCFVCNESRNSFCLIFLSSAPDTHFCLLSLRK